MDLADTIAIVIPRPFFLAVTHSVVDTIEASVALPLIRVTGGFFRGVAVDMFMQRFPVGMLAHTQPALPTLPTYGSDDGRTIILIGPMPPSLVGATARRIAWIAVFVPFFPPRSETSRRFPSRRPVTPVSLTSYTRWRGAACATDGHTDVRAPVPQLRRSRGHPYTRHALTTPPGGGPDYCPQKWFPYRGYMSADSYGSDNRQSHACASATHVPLVLTLHIPGTASLWGESVSLPMPYFHAHPRARL